MEPSKFKSLPSMELSPVVELAVVIDSTAFSSIWYRHQSVVITPNKVDTSSAIVTVPREAERFHCSFLLFQRFVIVIRKTLDTCRYSV